MTTPKHKKEKSTNPIAKNVRQNKLKSQGEVKQNIQLHFHNSPVPSKTPTEFNKTANHFLEKKQSQG